MDARQLLGVAASANRFAASSGMARPHGHGALACLSVLILLLPATATAASYSSLCQTPAPAHDLPAGRGHGFHTAPSPLPEISAGHFSGGKDLRFAPDLSRTSRSFSLDSRRAVRATEDPAVRHVFATLTLAGTRRDWRGNHGHPHSVSFDLDGYYSTTSAGWSELCMVGSGSYAREDGFGVVLLSDVVLSLRVPRPSNLSRPFVTGRLQGANFRAITLVAYPDIDIEYTYGAVTSCLAPPPPVLVPRHEFFSCRRLKALLRGSYILEYTAGGDAASSTSPLRLRHQRMRFDKIRCGGVGALRAYMAFDTDTSDVRFSNYSVGMRQGLVVGDEALVAEGFWNTHRSQFCLRACRVERAGPSRADLAVRDCSVGVSLWFPAVWSIHDRKIAGGMIWNSSLTASDGGGTGKAPPSGVISVSRGASYRDDVSYVTYNYTRVREAKKLYRSNPALSKAKRNGTFPGNYSFQDFAFNARLKRDGVYGYVYASPVTIGSAMVQGHRLMADEALYSNWTGDTRKQRLLNISYDLQYFVGHPNSTAGTISRQWLSRSRQQHHISAEGVYNTETGSLCMVACQEIGNGSSDCEILITAQFAPVDAVQARERVVVTIGSLRKQGDPLFLEPLDFVAEGMYAVQVAESVSRMDTEGIMLVVSMTLSCVFTGLQLLHVKRHPEALPATSVTMLVVLAVGYAVPLVLNLEAVFADTGDSRSKRFVRLTSAGLLELNEVVLRVTTMLAFVLQLRLLQLALASRRPAEGEGGGKQAEDAASLASDAERSTLWICLPLYLLGAVLVWIVHNTDGDLHGRWNLARSGLADDLAGYAGLVLDGFLLPQVVWNAFAGSRVRALSPLFYAGVSLLRAAPHVYDVFRRQNYVPSWAPSYGYASPRDDLFGVAWDVAVPCGAAVLAVLLFLQQRLGGAFLCGVRGRRPGEYEMVSTRSS